MSGMHVVGECTWTLFGCAICSDKHGKLHQFTCLDVHNDYGQLVYFLFSAYHQCGPPHPLAAALASPELCPRDLEVGILKPSSGTITS